uniref:WW domain-containing protein n=1 Tax=Globodera rostochiensis TaxID=31243 RepID=A0A914ICI8_GLORO
MDTSTSRVKEIGTWSEQFSSSGKRYYYNRETEVSQWEKPVEWKQAEKDQTEQRARSSTGVKEDKSTSYSKLRHRPSVSSLSSTAVAAHSTSASKPADSSTGHPVKSSASSPSVRNSSNAPKRPRFDEQPPPSSATRQVSSSSLSANKKVPSSSTSAAAVATVSSSTDHPQHRCGSVSSSSPAAQNHKTPPNSSFSSSTVQKRTSFSGSARVDSKSGFSKQGSGLKLASKSASNPAVVEQPKKGTSTATDNSMGQTHGSKSSAQPPIKNGTPTSEAHAPGNSIHRSGSTNSKVLPNFEQHEKHPQAPPREDLYTKFYHHEPGAFSARRALSSEEFLNNLKRCSDRKAKHANILLSIDRDLHSIQTLTKTAEFRSQLIKQRSVATSKRIHELESKSQ